MKRLFPTMTAALLLTSPVLGSNKFEALLQLDKLKELKEAKEYNEKKKRNDAIWEFKKKKAAFDHDRANHDSKKKFLEQVKKKDVAELTEFVKAEKEVNDEEAKLETRKAELKQEEDRLKKFMSGSSRVVPSLLMMVIGGIMLLFVN